MPKKTYTVKEVANLLGFSTNTVYKYLEEGRIKSTRLGKEGRFRVSDNEMARLLQESKGVQTQPTEIPQEIQEPALEIRPRGAPSLFDWFIGFLSISLGFSQFIFPAYSMTSDISRYLAIINIFQVLLFIGGIILIAFDILKLRKDAWHSYTHIALGVVYFCLGAIFVITGVIPNAVGFLAVAAIIGLTAFFKPSEFARFLIYVNIMYFLLGVGVLVWPAAFVAGPFIDSSSTMLAGFFALWFIGLFMLLGFTRLAIKNGSKYMIALSVIISIVALSYATFAFTNGYWGRSIYCVILGAFAIIFPFSGHFESFTLRSKKELLGSFAWLFGLFFLGSIVLYFLYYSFQSYVFLELKNRVSTASDILVTFINGNESKISAFSRGLEITSIMQSNPTRNTIQMDEMLRQLYLSANGSIRRVILSNKDGIIVDTYPYNPSSQGVSIASRDYYRNPALGTPIYLTGIVQPASPGVPPSILITAPILDDSGNFLGVLEASSDIAEMTRRLGQVKFGIDGMFLLADTSGKYIIAPNSQGVLTQVPADSLLAKAIKGESGVTQGYDANGDLVFSAYSRVDPYGWGLLAQQPFSEVFRTYSVVGFVTFLVFVMSGVGSLVLVIHLKKRGSGAASQTD